MGMDAADLKDLSVAALLGKLATNASGDEKTRLLGLVEAAQKLGVK